MIRIDVKGIKEVQDKFYAVQRDMRDKALQPALNKTAEKARAEINRAIPEEYAVKTGEVRSAIQLRRAQSGRLEAVIEIFGSARKRGRSLNLIHFMAAFQKAGKAVAVKGKKSTLAERKALAQQLGFLIKRGGGLKKIDGAFVGNKGRTIFRRTGKNRLPIESLQVIGFSQMFMSRKINQRILDKINTELPIEVDRSIARMLAR